MALGAKVSSFPKPFCAKLAPSPEDLFLLGRERLDLRHGLLLPLGVHDVVATPHNVCLVNRFVLFCEVAGGGSDCVG